MSRPRTLFEGHSKSPAQAAQAPQGRCARCGTTGEYGPVILVLGDKSEICHRCLMPAGEGRS